MRINKLLPLLLVLSLVMAKEPTNRSDAKMSEQLFKSMYPSFGVVEHVIWDGNQISTVHGNHGDVSSYHITGNSGTEWPKGSGKLAIFQSGIWLASGKTRPAGSDQWEEEIRTAAAEYTVEFVPGTVDEVTNDGHIYEIHRAELDAFLENDYATYSSMSASLPRTVIDGANIETVPVEKSFPTNDFKNWPVDAGAPWVDANGDGIYNIEDGDHPDILGDMFHWYVMNDSDPATHTPLWGTRPMNAEVQTSLFGFDQSGPLGSILFVRWVIINKGADDLDSMFVSMWHDDDVGDASDDLVGCDTLLSVGYTYNDIDGDGTYGVEVPAAGADFFQGPLVDSPGDTATILTWSLDKSYHVKKISDKKRLGLTSFAKYINGNPIFADPNTAEEAYRYMNGLVGTSGDPFVDPITGKSSVFVHAGDPVSGNGWLDDTPGDRRYLMTSGPFYFGSGDTVEVVGSIIIAAGSNWKKSITKMKYFDNFAQGAFDANFDVCSPPTPLVEFSQLDQKVVLSFEEGSGKVEEYSCAGYDFQGYNVYQGESSTGPWHRIATYDVVDGVKIILDWVLDEVTGELLEVPAQFGTDSDIEHYIEITDDEIGNRTLINYRQYFFAVTAYAFDPDAAKRVIESPANALIVVPGIPGVGKELAISHAEALEVAHSAGTAAAAFSPTVIDPYMLNGLDYAISFEVVDSVTNKWILSQGTTTILEGTDFPVTQDHYDVLKAANGGVDPPGVYVNRKITDGFLFTVENGLWSISGNDSAKAVTDLVDSTAVVFSTIFPASTDGTWAGFTETIPVPQPSGRPGYDELQLDLEFRFKESGSIATYYSSNLQITDTVFVPFELWDAENDEQIGVSVYQIAGTKPFYEMVDGQISLTKNLAIMPVYEPYSAGTIYQFDTDAHKIGWMLIFDKDNTVIEYGNEFRIYFSNPTIPGNDVFTFTAAGLKAVADAKVQMDKINVFPNPYFGQNPEEQNPQDRRVYFTHLGIGTSTIRIFTISGDMVAKVEKVITSENDPDNRAVWNLRNQNGIPVASGMYMAHITVEDVNGNKLGERILKFAIFQPEERLNLF